MSGKGSTWDQDRLVPVTRHGQRRDVWWTYSYSPIDLDGNVGGVLVICNDVTAQHLAAESLKDQTEKLEQLFEQAPSFITVLNGPAHTFEIVNRAYKRLIGNRDVIGKDVRDALPEVAGQGFFELLDGVFKTGNAHVGRRVPLSLEAGPDGDIRTAYLDFVYQPIRDSAGTVIGIFVEGTDVTDHVDAESRLKLLNEELKHRVKNTIAMIGAIAAQTLRGRGKDAELDAFHARLNAFGRAHDILTQSAQTPASVLEVVTDALLPHRTGAGRFKVSGPEIVLGTQQALSLALAIHELATNATKYGALSTDKGTVGISWTEHEDAGRPSFQFWWQESGGPAVAKPLRSGFGTQLIKKVLAGEFGGWVDLSYEETGFICQLSAPSNKLHSTQSSLERQC
jgi:two-component sensor histidine kinase